MPDSSGNDELQKQYQDLLDQYTQALSQDPPLPPPPSPAIAPAAAGPPAPEPVPPPLPVRSPDSIGTKEGSSPLFFKILFYFSFLIFLVVVSAIVYSFTKSQPLTPVPSPTPIPTETQLTPVCELNDQTYQIGESFPAADGCNTCNCQPDQLIICTEIACEATPSTKLTLTVVPTKRPLSKIYKDNKYSYQFECPVTTKHQIVATSIDGNTIPYKQESCTVGDVSVSIEVYDNSVVHTFGNFETIISPDGKYVVAISGQESELYSFIVRSFKFL